MLDFSASSSSTDDMPKRTGRSSRRRAVPKLRDSCTGCAASKVRCTKEKPSCSRCARRGIKCEYIVTRRTGRTSCRTSQPVNRVPPLLALRQPYLGDDGAFDDPFGSPMGGMPSAAMPGLTPSSSGHASPAQQQVEAHPDMIWRGVMSPPMSSIGEMAPPTTAAAYMSMGSEMDNIFDPTFSFTESQMTKPGNEQFGYFNPENFTTFAAPVQDFFPTSQPAPNHASSISPVSTLSSPGTARFGDLERTQSSCSSGSSAPSAHSSSSKTCLDTTIAHLTRLLSSASGACPHSTAPFPPADAFSNIDSTISENAQILDSVTSTLDCTCAADDYLLVLLSLVVLKVLARYSAAAHVRPAADHGFAWAGVEDPFNCADSAYTPSSTSSVSSTASSFYDETFGMASVSSSISSMSSMGPSRKVSLAAQQQEQPNRPAAEKVLAELHRVRGVVGRVVGMMSMMKRQGRNSNANAHPQRRGEEGLLGAPTGFPIGGFEQMEKDLLGRLREVSMEMIDILRRE